MNSLHTRFIASTHGAKTKHRNIDFFFLRCAITHTVDSGMEQRSEGTIGARTYVGFAFQQLAGGWSVH